MNKILLTFVVSLFLTGCLATEYQPSGFSGGYTDQMTGPNTATVSFSGNGFTNATTAKKFVMKRASELTLQKGFDHFLIEQGDNSIKNVQLSSNIQCNSYGNSTTCNDYGGGSVSKPTSSIDIRMFKGKTPNESGYYDARYLSNN